MKRLTSEEEEVLRAALKAYVVDARDSKRLSRDDFFYILDNIGSIGDKLNLFGEG